VSMIDKSNTSQMVSITCATIDPKEIKISFNAFPKEEFIISRLETRSFV